MTLLNELSKRLAPAAVVTPRVRAPATARHDRSTRAALTTLAADTDLSADRPPVILVGGDANALSVARDLGRAGVRVYALDGEDQGARHSRYARRIALHAADAESIEHVWAKFLLGPESDHLRGAVLLACSDAAIQLLMRHRDAMQARFLLDDANPDAQRAMLDKLTTYQHARAAGVATPAFWEVSSRDDVLALREELRFPLMVKPRLSHEFEARFGRKHVIVKSFVELIHVFDTTAAADVGVLLMENIPGPDDLLCSYYTYIDERGEPLFHFTKRVVRRYPAGMGAASYHVTDWIPELVRPATKLIRQVGLRGLANVEFKLDPRDGQYKLIECNARFTASNCLLTRAGVNLAILVYDRITGRPHASIESYTLGLRLWDPRRDVLAFLELHRAGQLSIGQWLASIAHRQTFFFFTWRDPMPALFRGINSLAGRLKNGTIRRKGHVNNSRQTRSLGVTTRCH